MASDSISTRPKAYIRQAWGTSPHVIRLLLVGDEGVSVDWRPTIEETKILGCVPADELVAADGGCPGMATPGAGANALADGAAASPPPSTTGTVALGHTECDVVRGIGAPDNVSLSSNPRGDRVAVVSYSRGQRAGIYTFTAGRLTSIERGPEPAAPARGAKPKKKPAA